jgi:hypothetical protein
MFLNVLRRRNPGLISAAIELHQAGRLPANTYVLDLDAIEANANAIATEARRVGVTPFAMTKQIGRNPDACRAIVAGGIPASVAVDVDCAVATTNAGMSLGNVGHLVQVPTGEADLVASLDPDNWTVFTADKAAEAAAASDAAVAISHFWPASMHRVTSSTPATRVGSAPRRSSTRPTVSTPSTERTSRASRRFQRCCSTPTPASCASPTI